MKVGAQVEEFSPTLFVCRHSGVQVSLGYRWDNLLLPKNGPGNTMSGNDNC